MLNIQDNENFEDYFFRLLKKESTNLLNTDEGAAVGETINQEAWIAIRQNVALWLFGDDQEIALNELKKLNNPSPICGHVFKSGEATYSCRECAVDPTCVFCPKCFKESEHKKHKYRVHTSGGGGCCDCGDVEAWTKFPSCSLHNVTMQSNVDARLSLPGELRHKCETMFSVLLHYIIASLIDERENIADLPAQLQIEKPSDQFVTVVFNDESHTFDHVITTLQKATNCSQAKAADYATYIDREGRAMIKFGKKSECTDCQSVVTGSVSGIRHRLSAPLVTKVMHSVVFAHQEISLLLMSWMEELVKHSDGLRLLLSDSILTKMEGRNETFISLCMLHDTTLWKVARTSYQQLVLAIVMLDIDTKKVFAIEYVRCYERLVADFLKDDHDHADSITSLSVQIFTVPTLVKHLIVEENLLQVLLHTVVSSICDTQEGSNHPQKFELNPNMLRNNFKRLLYPFYDIKYVLTNVPSEWDSKIDQKFKEFFHMFCAFLASLEGMDNVERKVGRHIEHEPEWETGITFLMRLIPVLRPLYLWCSYSKEVLLECIRVTIDHLKQWKVIKPTTTVDGVRDYDYTRTGASVHIPLTRLLSGLLVEYGKLGEVWDDAEVKLDILDVADNAMQTICMCAQVTAGAWRRNGLSLANQVYYCRDYRCRAEAFDRDVQMMQLCAALGNPHKFFDMFSKQMNLHMENLIKEHMTPVYEEFISLLIFVCVERNVEGIGEVSTNDITRRELIHILAAGPKPHSKIQKHLPETISEVPGWEVVLNEVADYRQATNTTSAPRYELKESFLDQVSPCYHHYGTATDQTNAQNEVIRRKKAKNLACYFTPHISPPFTNMFKKTTDFLCTKPFVDFIQNTLALLIDESTALRWSDKLAEKLFYLIGCVILEEREEVKKNPGSDFNFCQLAQSAKVDDRLRSLVGMKIASLHKENISWLLGGLEEVGRRRRGEESGDFTKQPRNEEDTKKRERRLLAEDRRRKLMNQMSQQQKSFMEVNPMFGEEQSAPQPASGSQGSSDLSSAPAEASVLPDERNVCILCQDDDIDDDCFVIAAFVQKSKVLSKDRSDNKLELTRLPSINNPIGFYVDSCSHAMHSRCWQQFFESVREKQEGRIQRMRRLHKNFNTALLEYLCPLCSRLSNCAIPVVPGGFIPRTPTDQPIAPLLRWVQHLNESHAARLENGDYDVIQERTPLLMEDSDATPGSLSHDLHDAIMASQESLEEWHDAEEVIVHESHEPVAMETADVVSEKKLLQKSIEKWKNSLLINCLDDKPHQDLDLALLHSAATVCQVVECVARYAQRPLMAPPSIRVCQTMRNVLRAFYLGAINKADERAENKWQFLPRHIYTVKCICGESPLLLGDLFVAFVKLVHSLVLYRHTDMGGRWDGHVSKICALAKVVQTMLFIDTDEITQENENQSDLSQLFNKVRSFAKLPPVSNVCDEKLNNCIRKSFQPFLRCCVLFRHYTMDVPVPTSLEQSDDFSGMLAFVGLPNNLTQLFEVNELKPFVEKWCSHPSVVERCAQIHHLGVAKRQLYPHLAEVNTLVKLDEDYSDMMARAGNFVCPRFRSDDDSVNPTLCLVCGQMLCSQSYCCQRPLGGDNVGACTYHAHECSCGFGIFLRVRENSIVLLNGNRGTFRAAPYIDEYGETDQGLRRGNPLKVDSRRLRELNLMWLEHGIAENIASGVEANRTWIAFDWSHL